MLRLRQLFSAGTTAVMLLSGGSSPAAITVGTTTYTFTGVPPTVSVTGTAGSTKQVPITISAYAIDALFPGFPLSVNYQLYVTSGLTSTIPNWVEVTPTTGTGISPMTINAVVNLNLTHHAQGNYQVRLRAKVAGNDAANELVTVINIAVVAPPATGFQQQQAVRVRSNGGYCQEMIYNYSTGASWTSPVQNVSSDILFDLPAEQWVGSYHYDYATARFSGLMLYHAGAI